MERNGYPTLHIGLEERERYLDAVADGNKGNYKPIIDLMSEVYLKQHKPILDEIYSKIIKGEIRAFPEIDELVSQFSKIKVNQN